MCAPSGARRPSQAAWAVAPRAHIQRAVLAAVAASALSAHTPRPSIEALRPVGWRDPLAAWRATSPAAPEGPRFAHGGSARPQRCQAHPASSLLTARQPPFVRPPQRRTSPPGRSEGASPKQGGHPAARGEAREVAHLGAEGQGAREPHPLEPPNRVHGRGQGRRGGRLPDPLRQPVAG